MTWNAIVAVNPTVTAQFEDEDLLAAMPIDLTTTVRGRQRGELHSLLRNNSNWDIFVVWGKPETLGTAIARWGEDLIVLGSWTEEGLRAGQIYVTDVEITEENINYNRRVIGTPMREIDVDLLSLLPDTVYYGLNGEEIARETNSNLDRLPVVMGHKSRQL